VLEHVKDLPYFVGNVKKVLKKNGLFYASFGPLWFGPCGDHIYWEKDRIFDHLLLPEDKYWNNFNERFSHIEKGSTEVAFIVKNDLFSHLSASDYFKVFQEYGFQKNYACAKISFESIVLLKKKNIFMNLDIKGVPIFDRFCSGLYIWMRSL